jgi:hypothetical protein
MPQNRLKRQRGLSYSVLPRDTHSVVAFLRSSYLITHDVQIEGFCKILDNIDLLAVLATGSGKAAFVSMFILIVLAIKKNSSLCLTAKFPDNPCVLFMCPTKYLEHQMVGAFKCGIVWRGCLQF